MICDIILLILCILIFILVIIPCKYRKHLGLFGLWTERKKLEQILETFEGEPDIEPEIEPETEPEIEKEIEKEIEPETEPEEKPEKESKIIGYISEVKAGGPITHRKATLLNSEPFIKYS